MSDTLVGETTGNGTANVVTTAVARGSVSGCRPPSPTGTATPQPDHQTYRLGGTPVSSANVLTSTDALGNTTQNAYTAFNQAWCTVDAADYANGSRCPSSAPTSPPAPRGVGPEPGMTINFYNSSDQLTATTDALGNTTTSSYTSGVRACRTVCSTARWTRSTTKRASPAPPTGPPT